MGGLELGVLERVFEEFDARLLVGHLLAHRLNLVELLVDKLAHPAGLR